MLQIEQTLPLSVYGGIYDAVVPKDHRLRKAYELMDFSFIRRELKSKYCQNNGRNAQDPVRMFKYLFLKTVYDLSDVGVVERSMTDMSFKFFLDMRPEDPVINPSTLTKFRKMRLSDDDLMNKLLSKTVAVALEKGVITGSTIMVDSTHSRSRCNPMAPVDILRLRLEQLRHALCEVRSDIKGLLPEEDPDGSLEHEITYAYSLISFVQGDEGLLLMPAVKERLDILLETLDDISDHYTSSRKDGDARVGHKTRDTEFFGYKTHEAMTPEGIITAAVVTSGEAADGPQLKKLVEDTRAAGVKVDTVIGDGAYSGDANLKIAADTDSPFSLVSPVNPMLQGGNLEKDDGFQYNKDANSCVCPAGHLALSARTVKYKEGKGNDRAIFTFDKSRCAVCARRLECMGDGKCEKTYSVSIRTKEQEAQIAFQKTETFKSQAKQRYKIEARFSHLKNIYGYARAKSYGLDGMIMQAALTMFTANVMKMVTLL